MAEPLSLLGEPKNGVTEKRAASLVAVVSIAGLIGGLLTAGLDYRLSRLRVPGRYQFFAPSLVGVPLGATLAISLMVGGLLRGFSAFWRTLVIVVLSSWAYLVSYWAAIGVELAYGKRQSMGQYPSYSPLSMFTGGFFGGLIVLYGVLLLVNPRQICVSVMFKILFSSVLAGCLGIAGWSLGGLHSLFVVWQTGTAFLLGLILGSLQSRSANRPAAQ